MKFLAAFPIAFFVTLFTMPGLIQRLRKLKAGQVIQGDGPQAHQSKSGTPTMGGIGIVIGLLAAVAAFWTAGWIDDQPFVAAAVILTLAYSAIGLIDDWLTIRPRGEKRGLSAKTKFALQLISAIAFVWWLSVQGNLYTDIRLGDLASVDLGWVYAPFAVLFITGMANFVNITDGLDGLAAGLTIILCIALSAVGILMITPAISRHSELYLALAGACAAFLWFNFNPAKVFMGDTGSLAIGALLPALAILTKTEGIMIIAGLVFILDGLSSALQWAVFKYTRIRTGVGRRVFKMSPVHHHFEMSGWPEQLVVVRFWILGGLFAVAAVLIALWSPL